MKTNKGKCLICKCETTNRLNSHRICLVCIDKFGSWKNIKNKLSELKINCRLKEEYQTEPIKPKNNLIKK